MLLVLPLGPSLASTAMRAVPSSKNSTISLTPSLQGLFLRGGMFSLFSSSSVHVKPRYPVRARAGPVQVVAHDTTESLPHQQTKKVSRSSLGVLRAVRVQTGGAESRRRLKYPPASTRRVNALSGSTSLSAGPPYDDELIPATAADATASYARGDAKIVFSGMVLFAATVVFAVLAIEWSWFCFLLVRCSASLTFSSCKAVVIGRSPNWSGTCSWIVKVVVFAVIVTEAIKVAARMKAGEATARARAAVNKQAEMMAIITSGPVSNVATLSGVRLHRYQNGNGDQSV